MNQLFIKNEEESLRPFPLCFDAPSHATPCPQKLQLAPSMLTLDLARISMQHHNFSLSQLRGMSQVL